MTVGCSKSEAADQTGGSIKVTFIELGSANCIPCKMEENFPNDVEVLFYDV